MNTEKNPHLYYRNEVKAAKEGFLTFFENLGYQRFNEEPLVPTLDPSLLFTNAFIVPLKPLIRGGQLQPSTRIAMSQRCLRAQNLKLDPLKGSALNYLSYFDMVGGLVGNAGLETLCLQLYRLMTTTLGLDESRLCVKASRTQTDFFSTFELGSNWAGKIFWDSERSGYYQWSYGEEGLVGRGVTFAYWDPSQNVFRDLGNIVELSYCGKIIGYEFGFGLETFVARKHGLLSPVRASLLAALMPLWNRPKFDMTIDLISVTHALCGEGIRPRMQAREYIQRKAMRALALQLEVGVLSKSELVSAVEMLSWSQEGKATHPDIYFKDFNQQQILSLAQRKRLELQYV